jgi:hypothetical protein
MGCLFIYFCKNFYLFSMIRIPEEKVTYFGLFGNWVRWPPSFLIGLEPKLPPK